VGKIKNNDALVLNEARQVALAIAEAGFAAIDTHTVMARLMQVREEVLEIAGISIVRKDMGRLFFVAVGKCAGETARAAEHILGELLTGGIAIDVVPIEGVVKIKTFVGTHPLPSPANIKAAQALVASLHELKENDVVIFAISGGGSTLLCLPREGDHEKEALIVKALTHAGATIQEMNTLRKHLSLARGGYLARYAYPARAISLIFSDVPGNDLGFVASGPTVRDKTTIYDAEAILEKYHIRATCKIDKCGLIETPKEVKSFLNTQNILAVSNLDALLAMEGKAQSLGYTASISATCLTGEASIVGRGIVSRLHTAKPKTAFLYAGETTVTVRGKGRGGRNLEVATAGLTDIWIDELMLPFASDGRDNGEFAGAICDTITKDAVAHLGFDLSAVLTDNDEYPLFHKVGHHLSTDTTGSNVSDLIVALKG